MARTRGHTGAGPANSCPHLQETFQGQWACCHTESGNAVYHWLTQQPHPAWKHGTSQECHVLPEGKSKSPIQQSLNVLNKALGHIEKYKTTSKKGDKGTLQRTAKHLLALTYHQMHMMMELSDYQVAAALLKLPSMIMSDTFQYGNPLSLDTFRTFIQMQEMDENYMDRLYDEIANRLERAKKEGSRPVTSFYPPETATAHANANDDWSEGSFIVPNSDDDSTVTASAEEDHGAATGPTCNSENVLQSLGHVTKVNLPLQTKAEDDDNSRSILVPTAALYLYRACPEDILAHLNYYEYLACIMFMNKPASPATVTDAKNAQQHELSPDFAGCTDCRHQLKIKQSTPLLIGRAPPHPGPKPVGFLFFVNHSKIGRSRPTPMPGAIWCSSGPKHFLTTSHTLGEILKIGLNSSTMTAPS